MRLLLIEDDTQLREQLQEGLLNNGFVVDVAADAQTGLYFGREFDYDAAIIDLGLPEMDGIELIQRLRSEERVFPVLVLTARGDWHETVKALNAGADDYVVKPYQLEEVVARINALVRRAAGLAKSALRFGPLHVDFSAKRLTLSGKPIELTAYEYKLIEYLIIHAGKVVSKAELTEHLYAQDHDRDSNVLEVFVRRLRQKLDPEQTLNPIETVRGQGYRFELKVDS